jgi:tetratricopeptide (TPR) repeat protein
VDEGNMLGDLGNILSTSGRCQEALEQVEQNLKDLPDDPWVIIKAGDVYDECGEPDKAIGLFSKALGMMNDQYTRDGAYERLIPLYEKMGKVEEARVMREQWKEDQEESIVEHEPYSPQLKTIHSKKIGRNEPCPCGSGLKYKKCCLNKE